MKRIWRNQRCGSKHIADFQRTKLLLVQTKLESQTSNEKVWCEFHPSAAVLEKLHLWDSFRQKQWNGITYAFIQHQVREAHLKQWIDSSAQNEKSSFFGARASLKTFDRTFEIRKLAIATDGRGLCTRQVRGPVGLDRHPLNGHVRPWDGSYQAQGQDTPRRSEAPSPTENVHTQQTKYRSILDNSRYPFRRIKARIMWNSNYGFARFCLFCSMCVIFSPLLLFTFHCSFYARFLILICLI